jgi:hypothetical protein
MAGSILAGCATLAEAVHLGRGGLGIEYEDRWAGIAAANVAHARRNGATGTAEVIRGDACQVPALLPPGTAGRAALVVTSPPYGPSVHGQVKAEQRRGQDGGVRKYDNRYGQDPANLACQVWTSCSRGSPRSWPAARRCCAPAGWPWSPPGPGASAASWSTCPPPSSPPAADCPARIAHRLRAERSAHVALWLRADGRVPGEERKRVVASVGPEPPGFDHAAGMAEARRCP